MAVGWFFTSKQEQGGSRGLSPGNPRLASAWNFAPGERQCVFAFSNGDRVELFLNGRSLGAKENEIANPGRRNLFVWEDVAFEAGTLEAVARKNGREIARHRLETTGPAVGIRLEAENADDWRADGLDLQYVRIYAVDAQGRRVADAQGEVRVSVSGAATLLAVDDGDAYSDMLFDRGTVRLHAGMALAIVRATKTAGSVTVSVDAGPLGKRTVGLVTDGASD